MTIEELRAIWEKKSTTPQSRRKSELSEHNLQVNCVNWFYLTHRGEKYAGALMSIPNGGYRSAKTARAMKAEGQQPGVPDLFLAIPMDGYHGLWIEMKNGKAGRLSDHQKVMIEHLRARGYKVVVCRSQAEFEYEIDTYLHTKTAG